jgi:hypothetical protein
MRSAFHSSAAVLFCFICLAGCSSSGGDPGFARSADKVSTGATKDQVRSKLGEPDGRRPHMSRGVNHQNTPELSKVLPPGTPYETWIYRRGNTDYLFYFASGSNAPVEQWKLVARRAVPHGKE